MPDIPPIPATRDYPDLPDVPSTPGHLAYPGTDFARSPVQVLLGRYEVVRILGRGAMGEVLEVHDRHSGTDYAMKRVPAELVRDDMQMAGIRSNFALVSQLTHPHICTTRQLEIDPVNGSALIIMDLIRGQDLAHFLATTRRRLGYDNAPLPIGVVLGIAEQIASALDYAHSQPISRGYDGRPRAYGILHRDLKPANVMVEYGREFRPGVPYVKLVDFGLAAEIQASLQSISVSGANKLTGTPVYMAPEQWAGRTLTRGVDQWALACLIYEMAAGRRPFDGPSEAAVMQQIINAEPEAPEALIPEQWEALKRTFQVDRKLRYASCMALVNALALSDETTSDYASAAEQQLPDEFIGYKSATMPSPLMMAPQPPQQPPPRQVPLAFALLFCLFVAGAGWSYVRWQLHLPLLPIDPQTLLRDKLLQYAPFRLDRRPHRVPEQRTIAEAAPAQPSDEEREAQEILAEKKAEYELNIVEITTAEQARKADESDKVDRIQHAQEAAEEAARMAAEMRKAQQSRESFVTAFNVALEAKKAGAWNDVIAALEDPLRELGEQMHPDRRNADEMLATARQEVQKQDDFAEKMTQAANQLRTGQFKDAQLSYTLARELWPDSPRSGEIDLGLIAARKGLLSLDLNTALSEGQARLKANDPDTALVSFQKAKRLDAENAEAASGISRVAESFLQLGMKSEAQKNFPDAAKWYRKAASQGDARAAENLRRIEVAQVLDLGGGTSLDLVCAPAGEFEMGSMELKCEQPLHKVRITKALLIGKYPVTVAQFRRFTTVSAYKTDAEKFGRARIFTNGEWILKDGADWKNPGYSQTDNFPVVEVSWNDAQQFVAWASGQSGRRVRLPTEAEWEYAARGPSGSKYPWGNAWDAARCNHADLSPRIPVSGETSGIRFTAAIGTFNNASWCGAIDLAGNVAQWCQDWYNESYYSISPLSDPLARTPMLRRVVRGGSWFALPPECRSTARSGNAPDSMSSNCGFRIVVEE